MAQFTFTFNIPEEVVNGFRLRYPKLSMNNLNDQDFMVIMIKGSMKVSYLDARNTSWNNQNKQILHDEIDGM